MKVGLHLPHVGPNATPENLAEFARRAEALGFDSLWVSDHVVVPRDYQSRYPYNPSGRMGAGPDTPFLEPLSTLLYVAGVTSRIALGTTVLVLPMREPVLHAKILATLDVLSEGRLILGVGAGWLREEFEALGATFEDRGRRLDEELEILRRLWTLEDPSFQGRYYRIGNLGFAPKPVQKPHPPIWVGGNTEPGLKRAVRYGDAWHGAGSTPEQARAAAERLRALCEESGRDPATLAVTVRTGVPLRPGAEGEAAERLARYREAGVSHVALDLNLADMGRALENMERLARDVRPQVGV